MYHKEMPSRAGRSGRVTMALLCRKSAGRRGASPSVQRLVSVVLPGTGLAGREPCSLAGFHVSFGYCPEVANGVAADVNEWRRRPGSVVHGPMSVERAPDLVESRPSVVGICRRRPSFGRAEFGPGRAPEARTRPSAVGSRSSDSDQSWPKSASIDPGSADAEPTSTEGAARLRLGGRLPLQDVDAKGIGQGRREVRPAGNSPADERSGRDAGRLSRRLVRPWNRTWRSRPTHRRIGAGPRRSPPRQNSAPEGRHAVQIRTSSVARHFRRIGLRAG